MTKIEELISFVNFCNTLYRFQLVEVTFMREIYDTLYDNSSMRHTDVMRDIILSKNKMQKRDF